MKKTICVLLAALMLAACLTGCGSNTESSTTTAPSLEAESIVFMTVNGKQISQRLFEYFLDFYTDNATTNTSEPLKADDITDSIAEEIRAQSVSTAISMGVLNSMCAERNITVTQEELDADWATFVESRGGEDAVNQELAANNMDRKIVDELTTYNMQMEKLLNEIYGGSGEKVSDEEALQFLQDNNVEYLMAKHILLSKTKTDEEGNSVDLTEEEKAEKLAEINSYLDELRKLSGDELTKRFDELMQEHSEDPGSTANPDGYLFREGDMVPEFYEATLSIQEGEVSDVVETDYGYHIILRLPLKLDNVPVQYSAYVSYGYDPSKLTLRFMVANTMFNKLIQSEIDKAKIENSTLLEEYNVAGHIKQYLSDKT